MLASGDLVITEVMRDPNAVDDTDGEWLEIYNASGRSIDLDGLVIRDEGSDSYAVSGSLLFADGTTLIFGNNADPASNGGIPVDHAYSGLLLGNNADELVLENAGGILDRIAWDNGNSWPEPIGASMNLDQGLIDATDNDLAGSWCASTSALGSGDRGTPGALNEACP